MIDGQARTLKLIEESPAADLLLPLVTALQQELGRETHVAKEVNEVAADIREKMKQISAAIGLSVHDWVAEFLRDEVNLNQSRLARLETSVGAVNDYLKGNLSDIRRWKGRVPMPWVPSSSLWTTTTSTTPTYRS